MTVLKMFRGGALYQVKAKTGRGAGVVGVGQFHFNLPECFYADNALFILSEMCKTRSRTRE